MIEEFWVIDRSGICLFHQAKDEEQQKKQIKDFEQLFGGLLSGILTVSKEVLASTIQKIEMQGVKFLFFTHHDLIFIVKALLDHSDKKIEKRIGILQENFIKKFQKELENFDGEITSFKKFEGDLNEIFDKMSKSEKWGSGLLNL